MELYVFNSKLERKGIVEGWFSVHWVRRYSKCGEFEIHLSFKEGMSDLLKEDDVIWKNDSEEAGVIDYVNIKLDEQGKEVYVIKGKFATGYLARRIIWKKVVVNETNEKIIRKIIDENVINPVDPDRKMDLIALGDLKNIGSKIQYQVSYKNLLEEVEGIASSNQLGIKTVFDVENKRFKFEVYEGLDRTTSQSVNPQAIFSQEFDNVLEQEYSSGVHDYKNVALIAGEGEGNARQFESVGVGEGLNRHELYVDARDLQSTRAVSDEEVPIPVAEYKKMLKTRGISKLAENKRVESFDSKIDLKSNLEYKKDFDLGDKVTVISKRWGLMVEERITEIEEVYEADGFNVYVVFGEEEKSIMQKIKREVN